MSSCLSPSSLGGKNIEYSFHDQISRQEGKGSFVRTDKSAGAAGVGGGEGIATSKEPA